MNTVATLPTSAHRETVWARALRDGLERWGPTPIWDAVVADLGYEPRAAAEKAAEALIGGAS